MTAAIFIFLVSLLPGMALGMAIMGLCHSKLWSVILGVILAALGLVFIPALWMAIPIGYMFLGIWYAWNDPDILYHTLSVSSGRAGRRGRW